MRYSLLHHPAFPGLLSKEDLFLLVERGSLARGDLCTDTQTNRDHTVGDIISGMRPPGGHSQPRIDRPAYREIRADGPEEEFDDLLETEEEPSQGEVAPTESYTPAGELILYQSHPDWLCYGKVLFLILLLIITTVLLMKIRPEYTLITILCVISLTITVIVARNSRDYMVTSERVEVIWGILGSSSKEVRICDIRSIDVYEKGLKGLLGLGTVDFSSSANAGIEVQFRDIRRAHEVKELVRELQRNLD